MIALQKYTSKLDSQCKKSKGRSLTMTVISLCGLFVDNETVCWGVLWFFFVGLFFFFGGVVVVVVFLS